jgi:glycosyltransferase involved in cell wall biosynthesis
MRVLALAADIPMPDRQSGDLRFSSLLRSLASKHEVHFCAIALGDQRDRIGERELIRYRGMLEASGIADCSPDPMEALQRVVCDLVLFESYHPAVRMLREARFRSPTARVVVDSVDVQFHRLDSRARLSGLPRDQIEARGVREEELSVYRSADAVIVVSEEDRRILLENEPGLDVSVIPNFHRLHPLSPDVPEPRSRLVFVGGFRHQPNVDAVQYFCTEVFPIVRESVPDAVLSIVGSDPPDAVLALGGPAVEIVGFVADTEPILRQSHVSIAPLRYGGGMKGKIGEAMATGLPVVTTRVGIEGFGLVPDADVLVGDTPREFARQVVRLVEDRGLYERVRASAWRFVRDNLAEDLVSQRALMEFERLSGIPVKRLPTRVRLPRAIRSALDRRVAWRPSS